MGILDLVYLGEKVCQTMSMTPLKTPLKLKEATQSIVNYGRLTPVQHEYRRNQHD